MSDPIAVSATQNAAPLTCTTTIATVRLGRRLAIGVFVALAATGCMAQPSAAPGNLPAGPFPPNAFVQSERDFIGTLGGVPVRIPSAYVRSVEYEGDPHWLEKRQSPPPTRTPQSQVVSFGILVHMPTMQPLNRNNQAQYEARGVRDLEWINSAVQAYSVFMKSMPSETNWFQDNVPGREPPDGKRYDYVPLPDNHGLKGWRATARRATPRVPEIILNERDRDHSMENHHKYFDLDGERINAYIHCGSGLASAPGGRRTCMHRFLLLPEMVAEVSIAYPPELLPNWRQYQANMRALILSWRTTPDAASTTPRSNSSNR